MDKKIQIKDEDRPPCVLAYPEVEYTCRDLIHIRELLNTTRLGMFVTVGGCVCVCFIPMFLLVFV